MAESLPLPANGQSEDNWTSTRAGTAFAAGVIAAEVSPLNELARVGAFAWAQKAYGDPLAAAAFAGGVSLLLEGGAAVVTADVLATERGSAVVEKLNNKIDSLGISKYLRTNLLTEVGIASIGGSAIVTAAKHRQHTERSREQNRRYGLTSAVGIGALTSVEAYMVSNSIEHPSPLTIGLGAVALGGLVASYKWAKRRITTESEEVNEPKAQHFSPQRLGLSAEDVARLRDDADVVSINRNNETTPLLVPVNKLYWFNSTFLTSHYKTEDIYYYAHPPIELAEDDEAKSKIETVLEQGGIVVYDTVTAGGETRGDIFEELDWDHRQKESLGGKDRFLNQYIGVMRMKESKRADFSNPLSAYEQYVKDKDLLHVDENNGPSMAETIEGEDAERLWDIYDKPFSRLGKGHPINAGFDKAGFMEALKDTRVLKVVNREEGNITTLAMFVNDFNHCPWLDKDYFTDQYPEAADTDNIYIFTGIVTDENHRGASYSLRLIDLLSKVASNRKSPVVITFECGDISAKYIPKAVRYGVWKSGVAKIKGVESHVSQLNYYAITK